MAKKTDPQPEPEKVDAKQFEVANVQIDWIQYTPRFLVGSVAGEKFRCQIFQAVDQRWELRFGNSRIECATIGQAKDAAQANAQISVQLAIIDAMKTQMEAAGVI